MATTWDILPMSVARTLHDAPPLRNEHFIEEASQTYSTGDPVMLAANEVLIWDDTLDPGLIGLTKLDASGVADTACVIEEIHQGDICEANAVNDSSATAIAATDIGKSYGVKEHADGPWIVDLSDTTNVRVKITGLAGMAEYGDFNPRVEFEWIPDFLFYAVDSA